MLSYTKSHLTWKSLISVICTTFLLSINIFSQALPHEISYQGILKNTSGAIVANGDYTLTFKLYETESGGTDIWTETKLINVTDGIITTKLGSINPIVLPFDKTYWLGITIGTDAELSPRTKLSTVPYSYMSMNVMNGSISADNINSGQVVKSLNSLKDDVNLVAGSNITITPSGNNLTISAAGGGSGTIGGSGTTNYIPVFTGTTEIGNSVISQLNQMVAIGLPSYSFRLNLTEDVSNNINPMMNLHRTGANSAISIRFTDADNDFINIGLRKDKKLSISSLNNNLFMSDIIVFDGTNKNVGIGLTSPEGLLHLRTAAGKQLIIGHINQPTIEWYFDVAGDATMTLVNEGRGTPIKSMTFNPSNGYVGIGNVANPSSPLEVAGTVTITGSASEVNRTQTGNANLVPIAYANVSPDGTISTAATTENVTLTSHAAGSGNYYFDIAGENIYFNNYVCIATIIGSSSGEISWGTTISNQLVIYTRDSAGAPSDRGFTFVVYKK